MRKRTGLSTFYETKAPVTSFPSGQMKMYKKAMLSHGGPCDATVNFDMYQILQWHRAVSLLQHGFLV